MVVDHQWHWVSAHLVERLSARRVPPRAELIEGRWIIEMAEGVRLPVPPPLLDLDEQLAVASTHGIDVVVSSPILLAEIHHLEPAEASELLEEVNAVSAAAQREHPDRFAGVAVLPFHDVDAALGVLDRAVADGLTSVVVPASLEGTPIASDATLPIFQRIEALGLPLLLHPAVRSSTYTQGLGMQAEIGIGWMYHTSLAALNLIQSGVLDECPELTVLHPHLGGVLPYVLGRLEQQLRGAERSLSEYLRHHFYTDTVNLSPGALGIAIATYGLDRVLYASDYPWVPIEPGLEYIEANATAEQRATIFANRLPGLRLPG